jgi:hypothetical protein
VDVLNARNRIAEALNKQGKTTEAVETSRETLAGALRTPQ